MLINRNIAMTILSLSLGSALAFGQATTTPTTPVDKESGHGKGNHSADHGMSSNKGAGLMVGKSDEQFMMKAAQGGLMEVEVARLAQEKASSSEVKEFARKLEQDHTKANDQLKQLAAQKNVQLPTDIGPHKAMVDKLRNASGDQFDKAFLKMQTQHHKKDISEFEKEGNRGMDSDVKALASSTLPTLQEHLRQAQELQGSTRGRTADKSATSGTSGTSATSGTSGTSSTSGTSNATGTSKSTDSSSKTRGENNPTPAK